MFACIRCWMSLFNPLIWLFFIPVVVFFVVMYLSHLSVVSFLQTFTRLSLYWRYPLAQLKKPSSSLFYTPLNCSLRVNLQVFSSLLFLLVTVCLNLKTPCRPRCTVRLHPGYVWYETSWLWIKPKTSKRARCLLVDKESLRVTFFPYRKTKKSISSVRWKIIPGRRDFRMCKIFATIEIVNKLMFNTRLIQSM